MPLELLISFVLPLQVVFGAAGEGGESTQGRPRKKKSQVLKKFWRVGKSFTHAQLQLPVSQSYKFIANPTRNSFQTGEKKREKTPFGKNQKIKKSARNSFFFCTKEEVNYDNYSDW